MVGQTCSELGDSKRRVYDILHPTHARAQLRDGLFMGYLFID